MKLSMNKSEIIKLKLELDFVKICFWEFFKKYQFSIFFSFISFSLSLSLCSKSQFERKEFFCVPVETL